MVQIMRVTALIVMGVLSACSMQPMIDASLPQPEGRSTAQPPAESPRVEPAPMPEQRAVVVSKEAPLPAAAQSLLLKAQQAQREGNNAGAIIQLERAVKIAPRSALVYFELAKAYQLQPNVTKAQVFAQKALSLGPSKALKADIKQLLASLS